MNDVSDEERATVERQLAMIVAQRGERLDDTGRAEVCERLLALRRQTAAVRQVALTGNDEPLLRLVPRSGWEQ